MIKKNCTHPQENHSKHSWVRMQRSASKTFYKHCVQNNWQNKKEWSFEIHDKRKPYLVINLIQPRSQFMFVCCCWFFSRINIKTTNTHSIYNMTHFGENAMHSPPFTGLYVVVVQWNLFHLVLLMLLFRHVLHLDISHFSLINVNFARAKLL